MKSKRTAKPIRNPFTNYQSRDEYGAWLGYKLASFDRKRQRASLTLILRNDHTSSAGRVHGGVISALFDASCGLAVFTTMGPEDFCSTVELNVNYFKPLEVGNQLTCQAQVVFRGNRLCTVQAIIKRKGLKEPVAMGSATFYVVVKKK
jgi:uncharacterized protein (TIGR00369 family)